MSGEPPIVVLLSKIKVALVDGLVNYTAASGRIANPREIAVALLACAQTTARKDPKMPFGKALAMLMVEACRNDRELAHAAVDDAFDAALRSKKPAA